MKDFREIIDFIIESEKCSSESFVQDFEDEIPTFAFQDEINDAIFKLRAHSEPLCESEGGAQYSTGFEAGLEMAASILENILKRSQESVCE